MRRFWDKVDPSAGSDACWEWTAYVAPDGYGRFHLDRVPRLAHRVAYEQSVGPIPDGLQIDHLCRNRRCVNPAHLEPVTQRVNLLRGDTFVARNSEKTHCPQGHPYNDSNTARYSHGRQCIPCRNERNARRDRRKEKTPC